VCAAASAVGLAVAIEATVEGVELDGNAILLSYSHGA